MGKRTLIDEGDRCLAVFYLEDKSWEGWGEFGSSSVEVKPTPMVI